MANKILLLSLLLLASCHKEESVHFEESDSQRFNISDPGQDFYVPSKIWDIISGVELKENFMPVTNMVFVPVKVQLSEKMLEC